MSTKLRIKCGKCHTSLTKEYRKAVLLKEKGRFYCPICNETYIPISEEICNIHRESINIWE